MKQYLLNIIQPDGPPPPADRLGRIMSEVAALRNEMKAADAWVASAGLAPASDAKVVRPRGAELRITDGPFAEAKEFIGGFTIVRAAGLDAALEWARKLATATTLPIEVRALREEPGCE
jgi:hypothetical protein